MKLVGQSIDRRDRHPVSLPGPVRRLRALLIGNNGHDLTAFKIDERDEFENVRCASFARRSGKTQRTPTPRAGGGLTSQLNSFGLPSPNNFERHAEARVFIVDSKVAARAIDNAPERDAGPLHHTLLGFGLRAG